MSEPRVLLGIVAIAAFCWWLNWVWASAATSGLTAPLTSPGEEEPSEALGGMSTLISLDLRSTEAADALKYIATKSGLNIAISKNVSGRVNLYLTDVPVRDVFDLILRGNELAYDMQGNVYNIMTETEYRTLYGRKFADLRSIRTFRLQYAIPQQAFNLLDTLKSEIGRLLVDEESGTVLVMDTPERLREMEKALAVLEQGGMTRVFDIKYADALDIENQLRDQLEVNKLGFVRSDERSNQVVVKTLPARMREIEELIRALDRKTREVLIDAKIVKVTIEDDMDAGINWDAVFTNLDFHGIDTVGDFRTTTRGTEGAEVAAVTRLNLDGLFSKVKGVDKTYHGFGDLLLGTVSRDGYELFRYLQKKGETKVISNPRILVTENQEAKIHVGTRQPYVTSTTTKGQTTDTVAEDVQFIDVGIQLTVTPRINADGYVTMKIVPEVSSTLDPLVTAQGNKIPIVDTSTAETTVMVKDGSTVVIGGLRKNEKQFSKKQIPYLGQIPIIGPLFFGQVDRDDTLSEIVVFITPHIVYGDELVTGDAQGVSIHGYRDYGPPLLSNKPSQDGT